MTKCAYCGEPRGDIAIRTDLKDVYPDTMQPIIVDFVPCEKCKKAWAEGVAIIGARAYDKNLHGKIPKSMRLTSSNAPDGLVPDGGYLVLDPQSNILKHFQELGVKNTSKGARIFVDPEILFEISRNATRVNSGDSD